MTPRAAATRYARALFDVVLKEGDVEQAGRELSAFAALLGEHEALQRVLSNPAVPAPRKRAVIEQLLARVGPLTAAVGKLLLMLADRDRLALVPHVAAAYRARLLDHAQVVRAEVTTAMALPADRVTALQAGLARATGRQVQLDNRVDPAIIGGAVTRIGSIVYDGSLTRQLEKMKDAISQGSQT
jgi:F-type H+-transporting ATPase subunit delta